MFLPDGMVAVLSAAIFRDETMQEILLGVRRPTVLVARHPDVLSTITMGLPDEVMALLYPSDAPGPKIGLQHLISEESWVVVGGGGYLCSTDSFVLESLFCRKLGVSSAILGGRFVAHARKSLVMCENVDDPLGTGTSEPTLMLTYQVVLKEDSADYVPSETECYSKFVWAPADYLTDAVRTRDVFLLAEDLEIQVCIHGLCVRSASLIL